MTNKFIEEIVDMIVGEMYERGSGANSKDIAIIEKGIRKTIEEARKAEREEIINSLNK